MKFIEILFEIIGWLQITIGVTLGASLIAFITYLKWHTETGKMVSIIIVSVGFVLGAIWATKIWKKHGTIVWLSKIRKLS